ncbi:hypothetical protein GCM10011374_29760 [Kocuria dechangensis]|uniref:Uncharacterized protein n=1 Tax=Kocuria dechangensis TaxID=1176249 RepID=A0A917H1B2_9MICC|nr:hypothetical protein GCM10011374_29760 [Kocuria dechangensis]
MTDDPAPAAGVRMLFVVARRLLIFAGPASAWVLGPIIGTASLLGARLESSHARAMDAGRGRPPAAVGGVPLAATGV